MEALLEDLDNIASVVEQALNTVVDNITSALSQLKTNGYVSDRTTHLGCIDPNSAM